MLLTVTMNPAVDKVYQVSNFSVDKVFRAEEMTYTAGGKGLNVARVIDQLDYDVTATGLYGGKNGEYISEEINKIGIKDEFYQINSETRTCINITDPENNTSTEVLEKGPIINNNSLESFFKHFLDLIDDYELIAASGSLPQGVPEDFYGRLIRAAKDKGKKFILDTSGLYFAEGIKAAPFMVTPNKEELMKLFSANNNSLTDILKCLAQLKEMGIELPLVTLGSDGCIVNIDQDYYHLKGPEIDVINPVGSGDSFLAGTMIGLSNNKTKLEAVRQGMACGMTNTQFFKTAVVEKQLIEKYYEIISIKKI